MSLRSRNAVDWAKSALPHRDVDSSRIASWNTPALLPSQRTHVRHTVFPHLNRRFAGACIYPQSSGRTFARCRLEPPGGGEGGNLPCSVSRYVERAGCFMVYNACLQLFQCCTFEVAGKAGESRSSRLQDHASTMLMRCVAHLQSCCMHTRHDRRRRRVCDLA